MEEKKRFAFRDGGAGAHLCGAAGGTVDEFVHQRRGDCFCRVPAAAVHQDHLLDRRERYFEEEARIFAQVLEEGECAGVFLIGDAVEKARILLLATNSLLPYSLSARELGERKEIERKIRRLAALLLQGLLKR